MLNMLYSKYFNIQGQAHINQNFAFLVQRQFLIKKNKYSLNTLIKYIIDQIKLNKIKVSKTSIH